MRLKNWIRLAVGYSLIVLCGIAFLTVYMSLVAEVETVREGLTFGAAYAPLFGGVLMVAISFGVYRTEVPLALSFGATRREVFVGLQLTRLLPILVIALASYVLAAVAGEVREAHWRWLFGMGCGWLLFVHALGVLLSLLAANKGKTIVTIFGSLIGFSMGVVAALGVIVTQWSVHPVVAVIVLIAGAAAAMVVMLFERKKLFEFMVRL